jgi:hypothetical protein
VVLPRFISLMGGGGGGERTFLLRSSSFCSLSLVVHSDILSFGIRTKNGGVSWAQMSFIMTAMSLYMVT